MDIKEIVINTRNWVDSAQDFYVLKKSHRLQPGLNPRTLDLEASTVPLDHRGRPRSILNNNYNNNNDDNNNNNDDNDNNNNNM